MRGRFSGVIESEREGWESGRRLPGVVQDGLTGGAEGWMWYQVSARVTRIGSALADRPRVGCGPSAVVDVAKVDLVVVDRSQPC